MLALGAAHVSEGAVVRYVSGDEGDLVHHVLVLDHLSGGGERIESLAEEGRLWRDDCGVTTAAGKRCDSLPISRR